MRTNLCRGVTAACMLIAAGALSSLSAAPIISEFMASNQKTVADEDGDFSDWIEIYNPDAAPVNLAGWRLTDNAGNPGKWAFPEVTLQPGDFLLVFASNKNRRVPGAPLHTNFALSAGGEYLALLSPEGEKSTEFAPAFPPQEEDVSYGSPFSSANLITAGQTVRYLVPASASPETSAWTAAGFDDAAWPSGPTGLGFGLMVPGMIVKEVQTPGQDMGTLAALDAALARPHSPPSFLADTRIRQVINFLGDGSDGVFPSGNAPFVLGGETHGLRATGFISIPTTGQWTFGVNSDDGSRLRIDINGDGDFNDTGENVIVDDTGHGPQTILRTVSSLSAGAHKFEFVYFENYGGDEVEFFAQSGRHTSFNNGFRLVGDVANGGLAVSTPPDGASGGGSVIATNLQPAMAGGRTSAYLRARFTIADEAAAHAITALNMGMSYNDGFVAYLNGVKVAERNAPATPAWDGLATGTRDAAASLAPENINITAFRSALAAGANTLAIHGLNAEAADGSFLLLPTLTGGGLQAGGPFYYKQPTPGSLNNTETSLGSVAAPAFSHTHGFYSESFTLNITSSTPGASLRYTLDGSKPTETHGTLAAAPDASTPPTAAITINDTRAVRAMAFKENYDSSFSRTSTYLFLDSVLQQPSTPPAAGWPDQATGTPGKYTRNGQEFDYGMDPDIVNSTNPAIGGAAQVKAALQAIPTVCVTVPVASLVDASTGIYTNPGQDGYAWEREASIEMINDPQSAAQGFQENCGLRIRGGFSRSADNPKHAFRILFRGQYGAGKLNYPVFPHDPTAVTEFDKFDIQTAQNYSWAFQNDGANTFLRELWCRDTQLAMNQPSTRGRFVHLYLNGLYWGLYQIQERAEADYAASYFGGTDDDYDVVKVETTAGYNINPTAGDLNAWTDLWNKSRASYFINTNRSPVSPYSDAASTQAQKNEAYFKMMGLAADGATPTADPVLLDVDNLIDYMLIIFYSGNTDAPLSAFLGNNSPNNFYSIRDRRGGHGFIHIQHDGEHSLNAGSAASNRVGPFNDPIGGTWNTLGKSNAQFTHQDLAANAEYRIRFADRAHKHLVSPHGALQTQNSQDRMSARAAVVQGAIIAESARWGDSKRGTGSPYTADHWRNAVNATLSWFNGRGATVLNQLRSAGLYPSVGAPVMSQPGGRIAASTPLTMSSQSAAIYYTVNGADPRLVGGGVAPGAQSYVGGVVSTVAFVTDGPSGTRWRYLDNNTSPGPEWMQPSFTPGAAWKGPQAGQLGYGEGDETSPAVSFGPDSGNKYITTYFRTTFEAADLANLSNLTLNIKRDDGIIVYLNGVEIIRDNMPAGAVTKDTLALAPAGDDGQAFVAFDSLPLHLLSPGSNTLAIEVHQNGGGSTDLSFDCRLTAVRTTGGTQIFLNPGEATVRARVRTAEGEWSALNEQVFQVDVAPPSTGQLVVSELMYHPADPSAEELAAGFAEDQEFQWLELQNVSGQHIDLGGAYFSEGIEFVFSGTPGAFLPPGGRVIICENIDAFRMRYGASHDAVIAGQYTGALSNGGERLVLRAANGEVILEFAYSDDPPWPVEADGGGRSLVLIAPSADSNLNAPESWRPSAAVGGSPGGSDAMTYEAWKTAHGIASDTEDSDHDGLNSLQEYAFGGDPDAPSGQEGLRFSVKVAPSGPVEATDVYLVFEFEENLAADDVAYVLEHSTSLEQEQWAAADVVLVARSVVGNTSRIQAAYRSRLPYAELGGHDYFRLRVLKR